MISLGTSSGAARQAAETGTSCSGASDKLNTIFSNLPDNGKIAVFIVFSAIIIIGIAMSILGSAIKLGYCRYNIPKLKSRL